MTYQHFPCIREDIKVTSRATRSSNVEDNFTGDTSSYNTNPGNKQKTLLNITGCGMHCTTLFTNCGGFTPCFADASELKNLFAKETSIHLQINH